MAEPDFTMAEEPAWLRESQKGSFDFLRPYVAGKEHRLNERRVSIAEEQLATNLKAAEQDYRMKQFVETDYLRNREMTLRAEAEAEKLLPQIESLLAEGGAMKAYYQLTDAASKNPILGYSKLYNQQMKFVLDGIKHTIDKTKADALLKSYDARESLGQQRIDNEKARLRNALERLRQSGARLDQQTIDLIVDSAKEGFDVSEAVRTIPRQTIPVGPTTDEIGPPAAPVEQKPLAELIKPVERPLTTGTITDLQQGALRASNSLRGIQDAIRFIRENPNAVGPRGVIGEQVEKIAGIINPTFRPTPITDTRTKLRTATTDILRSMRVDSQMSNYERRKLDEIADVSGWIEDPGTAVNQLGVLSDAIVASQLRREKALHRSPSDELLRQLRQAEIASLVQDGLLTVEEAIRWKNLQ